MMEAATEIGTEARAYKGISPHIDRGRTWRLESGIEDSEVSLGEHPCQASLYRQAIAGEG